MTSPAFKVIKKVSVKGGISDDKNEQQVIQISVSNDPVQIFTDVNSETLSEANNSKDLNPDNRPASPVSMPVVQLEIGDSDSNPTSSTPITSLSESKSEHNEDNVFMIPPLLRVRQFSVQERLPISVDEIRRRIKPPESLSQAVILSLLRLNKERAKHLRKALSLFGIAELPSRSAVVSSFSRLSEAEARGLAEDYYYLASRFMKVKELNQSLSSQYGGHLTFAPKVRRTRLILEQILGEIEKRDSDLNLLTHDFSPLILRAVFNIIIEILTFKEEREFVFDSSNKTINL